MAGQGTSAATSHAAPAGQHSTGHAQRLRARYGDWAVVTGASDGMGRALAEQLASAGFNLVLVARRKDRLAEIARALSAANGIEARALALDLAEAHAARRLLSETEALDSGLVVLAAGFGTSGPLREAPIERELEMLQVNCGAVLVLAHGFARRLTARGGGGLVFFGSLVGWQGVPNAAHYSATKAYVQALAEGLRGELAGAGIDVLSVAPGPVASGFGERADMRMNAALPADAAAKAIFRALGTSGTVVPGRLGKLLTWSLAPLPRPIRARIMGRVMQGMTEHHGANPDRAAEPAR